MSFKQPTGQEESCRWTLFTQRGCAGTTPEGPRPRPPRAPAGQPPTFSSVQAAVWVPESQSPSGRRGHGGPCARSGSAPLQPGARGQGWAGQMPQTRLPQAQPAREGRRCVSRRFPGPSRPGCQVSVFTALIRLNWPRAGGDYIFGLRLPMTGLLMENSGHHDALSSTLLFWMTAFQRFL